MLLSKVIEHTSLAKLFSVAHVTGSGIVRSRGERSSELINFVHKMPHNSVVGNTTVIVIIKVQPR